MVNCTGKLKHYLKQNLHRVMQFIQLYAHTTYSFFTFLIYFKKIIFCKYSNNTESSKEKQVSSASSHLEVITMTVLLNCCHSSHCIYVNTHQTCMCVRTQSCPTLSNPVDCSLLGSSVHGIFQARVLEWGAIAFSPLECRATIFQDS